jgi:adenosine deaminase
VAGGIGSADRRARLIRALPKAELHVHLEGTLEPELLFELAHRNGVTLPYPDVDAARRAYVFEDLASFLEIYYAGCAVLRTADDFYDLTAAYMRRAASEGVRHAEVFFDPQTHTARGIAMATVVTGIHRALRDGLRQWGISSRLIMCFLRDHSQASAFTTLEQARPLLEWISAVGLDSAEFGNPPEKFGEVFDLVKELGLPAVAHAGEEGPPRYIWEALDRLGALRIDHGVTCVQDDALVDRLRAEQIPLTVCPLSNVKLRVVPRLEQHNLATLLRRGLLVTVNSDDPAYFGGYVADNLIAVAHALDLEDHEVLQLARNSFVGSFLSAAEKEAHLTSIDRFGSSL